MVEETIIQMVMMTERCQKTMKWFKRTVKDSVLDMKERSADFIRDKNKQSRLMGVITLKRQIKQEENLMDNTI